MKAKKLKKHSSQKEFSKFLQDKKLPLNSLLRIYSGAWVVALFSAFYFGLIQLSTLFSQFPSLEYFLVIWFVVLVVSFFIKDKDVLEKVFVYVNNVFLASVFGAMTMLMPEMWLPLVIEMGLFLLLVLNWMGANFYHPMGIILTALLSLIWLGAFSQIHASVLNSRLDQLSIIYLFVYLLVLPSLFVWNSSRTKQALWADFQKTEQLRETAKVLQIRVEAKTRQLREQTEDLKQENKFKTDVLRERIKELERFKEATVGRELKMIKLKKKIQALQDKVKKLEQETDE